MPDSVVVPHLLGLPVPEARKVTHTVGLVLVSEWRDGTPLGALTWPGRWIITSQKPEPGAERDRWDELVVTFRRVDGGDEDPVPARLAPPSPSPLRAAAEPEDEAGLLDLS